MRDAEVDSRAKNSKRPCISATTLAFRYDEKEYPNDSDWFGVGITFPIQVKETVMIKEIDIQTAIGNSGGYIGLLLGNIIFNFTNLFDYHLKHEF